MKIGDKSIKIKVDKKKCMGCGACVAIAPEIFELGQDGKSQVKKDVKQPVRETKKLKEAQTMCPAQAIIVLDNNSK